jgi:hypothetical protein
MIVGTLQRRWLPSFVGAFAFLTAGVVARAAESTARGPVPLERAHAHNDYGHARPLLDALDHGFCSIEADLWVSGDNLQVGHTVLELRPRRTLEALYLRPLAERTRQRGGWVYEPGRTVTLLVDFKTDGEATYSALARQLEKYRELFAPRDPGEGRPAAPPVLVVISGNRPVERIAADADRLCGIDGRLGDLEATRDAALVPLISDAWASAFAWRGEGPMPLAEREKLRALVEKTHASGRRLRFWGAPDDEAVWAELYDAGVDLIGADDLAGLQAFLTEREGRKR